MTAERDPSKGRGHSRVKGQWADGSPVVPVGKVRWSDIVDDETVVRHTGMMLAEHAARAKHNCMFHDEVIPDAPCVCGTIEDPPLGSHPIVAGLIDDSITPVAVLEQAAADLEAARAALQAAVDQARESGTTWTEVGAALGIKKQTAWEKFGGGKS